MIRLYDSYRVIWGYKFDSTLAYNEADVYEQITIDSTFIETPCLKAVYDSIGGSATFKNYLKNFDGDFSVADLRFSADDNFSQTYEPEYWNALAVTNPPQNSNILIEFNGESDLPSSIHHKPELVIVVAFIHEVIHAEIFRKMLSAAQNGTLNGDEMTREEQENYVNNLRNNFPGIYDYYVDRWRVDWGHQMMAQHYINIISSAVSQFDNRQHSQQVYEALAWIGLENTIAWNNLTLEEKDAIQQTRNNYLQNETNICD